jgi:CheY-like chemotaxis protein
VALIDNDETVVVMVVDDNEDNRELLNFFLSRNGFKIIEASNGLEAVRFALSTRPDLIIMDLSMPVMDGYTAVRLLRQVPQVSDVPIVACTSYDTATHRTQAIQVGFNEFLSKPIDFTELNSVVDRFLKTA